MTSFATFTPLILTLTMRLAPQAIGLLVLIIVLPVTLLVLGAGFAFRWGSHWLFGTSADSRNRTWLFFKRGVLISGGVAWLVLTVVSINAPGGPHPESVAVANLRTINTAEVTYLSSSGGTYGSMTDLIAANLLDDTFIGTKAGYNYSITLDATGSVYTAEAVPASTYNGRYGRFGYYSHPDAVVRYSTNVSLAPAGKSGCTVEWSTYWLCI
jgi:hypothetical protein